MNPIDIGLMAILAFFVIKGLIRGIILEALILAGIVFGYLVALRQLGIAAALIKKYLHLDGAMADAVGFIAVFFVVFLLCRIIAGMLRNVIAKTPASVIDKGGGAVFGAVKGVIICGIIAVLLNLIPVKPESFEKVKKDSVMLNPCYRVATGVFNAFRYMIPNTKDFTHELKEGISGKAEEIKEHIMQEQLKSIEEQLNN